MRFKRANNVRPEVVDKVNNMENTKIDILSLAKNLSN